MNQFVFRTRTSEATVSPAALTFTPDNWSKSQTVTLKGVGDKVEDGDVDFVVKGAVASDDPKYAAITIPAIKATTKDIGVAKLPPTTPPSMPRQSTPTTRIWTSLNGRTFSGKFVKVKEDSLILQKGDGVQIDVSLKKMSLADQIYVQKHVADSDDPFGKIVKPVQPAQKPNITGGLNNGVFRLKNKDGSDALQLGFATEYEKVWADFGTGASESVCVWRPKPKEGFLLLGDWAEKGYNFPSDRVCITVKDLCGDAIRPPVKWETVWADFGTGGSEDGVIRKMIPPPGYVAMGYVAYSGYNGEPPLSQFACIRKDLVTDGKIGGRIYCDKGSGGEQNLGLFASDPSPPVSSRETRVAPGTFLASNRYEPGTFDPCCYCFSIPLPEIKNEIDGRPILRGKLPSDALAAAELAGSASSYTIVPWFAVPNDKLPAAEKLKRSPIYLMERKSTYRVLFFDANASPNLKVSKTYVRKRGFERTSLRNWSNSIGISTTVEGKAPILGGLTVSTTITFEHQWGGSESNTESGSQSKGFTYEMPGESAVVIFGESAIIEFYRVEQGARVEPSIAKIEARDNGETLVFDSYPHRAATPK